MSELVVASASAQAVVEDYIEGVQKEEAEEAIATSTDGELAIPASTGEAIGIEIPKPLSGNYTFALKIITGDTVHEQTVTSPPLSKEYMARVNQQLRRECPLLENEADRNSFDRFDAVVKMVEAKLEEMMEGGGDSVLAKLATEVDDKYVGKPQGLYVVRVHPTKGANNSYVESSTWDAPELIDLSRPDIRPLYDESVQEKKVQAADTMYARLASLKCAKTGTRIALFEMPLRIDDGPMLLGRFYVLFTTRARWLVDQQAFRAKYGYGQRTLSPLDVEDDTDDDISSPESIRLLASLHEFLFTMMSTDPVVRVQRQKRANEITRIYTERHNAYRKLALALRAYAVVQVLLGTIVAMLVTRIDTAPAGYIADRLLVRCQVTKAGLVVNLNGSRPIRHKELVRMLYAATMQNKRTPDKVFEDEITMLSAFERRLKQCDPEEQVLVSLIDRGTLLDINVNNEWHEVIDLPLGVMRQQVRQMDFEDAIAAASKDEQSASTSATGTASAEPVAPAVAETVVAETAETESQ